MERTVLIPRKFRQRLLLLRCLYEYGQDSDLTTRVLTTNLSSSRFWTPRLERSIQLSLLTDTDYCVVAMLIDKVSALPHSVTPPDTLDISNSTLTCTSLHALVSSLAVPTCSITKLKLWLCQLDDQCAYCLGQHLSNTKITELELHWNKITDVGVEYLVNQCPGTFKNLTKLSMSANEITDAGLMHLINHCPSLTELDLSRNKITDNGVEYLTNHCPSNLYYLDLSANQITDAGVKCLADRCPKTLRELDLSDNKITDKGLDYIVNHRPINQMVLYLLNAELHFS
ncbi:Protein NLRC5 [Exaiptasia diaphana]|nr:Protein NLRC5 [Exaiptasia diaphana]